MSEAHDLSCKIMGNPHSFVMIHSGGFVAKRHNLHMHVFVIRHRWQKAWLYTLLTVIHITSALVLLALKLVGRAPDNSFKKNTLRGGKI